MQFVLYALAAYAATAAEVPLEEGTLDGMAKAPRAHASRTMVPEYDTTNLFPAFPFQFSAVPMPQFPSYPMQPLQLPYALAASEGMGHHRMVPSMAMMWPYPQPHVIPEPHESSTLDDVQSPNSAASAIINIGHMPELIDARDRERVVLSEDGQPGRESRREPLVIQFETKPAASQPQRAWSTYHDMPQAAKNKYLRGLAEEEQQ